MNNLKNYREKELVGFVVANTLIIVVLSVHLKIKNASELVTLINSASTLLNSIILTLIIYGFLFLADSLLTSTIKQKLFCFGLIRIPGETIFTRMKEKNIDKRFSKEKVNERYFDVYEKIEQLESAEEKYSLENQIWYSIYTKFKDDDMIAVSHRDFLLCRDMYIVTIVIAITYIISSCLIKIINFTWASLFYLLFMLVITNIATHVRGRKFVSNVIARDIYLKE